MKIDPGNPRPIFLQVADGIEEAILTGAFVEGEQVPSTTEFAATWGINPATALKGLNLLENDGILEKRRGLGTFVRVGALDRLSAKRLAGFEENYLRPLLREAHHVGVDRQQLIQMIETSEWEELL